MNETNGITESSWIWGSVWIFYALFYGRYFKHVARQMKPDLRLVDVQGSPERLARKARSCRRFALFLSIPTVLDLIRTTDFTRGMISLAPCLFGIWVMYSVWNEVFRSKIPKADAASAKYRERL
ncbi:hypothetical protein [Pelagicoccus sp. SDUM812002]|uniref:hypothetical protein n=1 Tax=Pelagicoccus sp. SDUM812002 TaxID=3041266 RepID=UPI00280FDE8A|nr:hypothetical protein [Pelagicoccus sp. SDUM812002]MDQ8185135.1 hypothetical protein [Pelagicoccus sp. SDUM812002]